MVAEREAKRDGRVVERIGYYNPLTNPVEFEIKEERALYWLSVGAQPSDAVNVLLKKQGTLDRLARLKAGESLESLVTEFTGVAPEATRTAETKEEPTIVERIVDAAGDAAAAVAAPVAAVAEKVSDVAEDAVERIEDAIDAVLDADEEE